MQTLFGRLFHLRPQDSSLALVFGCLLFSHSLAMQMSEIAAVSHFLSASGVNGILGVWMMDALLVIGITSIQTLMIDRFDRIQLMQATALAFASAFAIVRILFVLHWPDWLNYSLFYLLVGQQLLLFPLVFWLLANDLCSMAQAKRVFPLIASGGLGGKLVGIGLAAILPTLMQQFNWRSEELLTVNVLIYFGLYALVRWGLPSAELRQTAPQVETLRETLTEGWEFVHNVPSFRFLTIASLGLILCDTVIEFRFLEVSHAALPNVAQYQVFYSLYYLVRTVLLLLIQIGLTGYLMNRLGLKNTFFVLPLCVVAGLIWMIGIPGLISSLGGILLQKVPQYSIDESSRKAFLALVPEERRGRVSLFIDNYVYAGGVLLGCTLIAAFIGLGTTFHIPSYFYLYLIVALAASTMSLWAIAQFRSVYDVSLFNWRLKRRQRGKSVLDKLDF